MGTSISKLVRVKNPLRPVKRIEEQASCTPKVRVNGFPLERVASMGKGGKRKINHRKRKDSPSSPDFTMTDMIDDMIDFDPDRFIIGMIERDNRGKVDKTRRLKKSCKRSCECT